VRGPITSRPFHFLLSAEVKRWTLSSFPFLPLFSRRFEGRGSGRENKTRGRMRLTGASLPSTKLHFGHGWNQKRRVLISLNEIQKRNPLPFLPLRNRQEFVDVAINHRSFRHRSSNLFFDFPLPRAPRHDRLRPDLFIHSLQSSTHCCHTIALLHHLPTFVLIIYLFTPTIVLFIIYSMRACCPYNDYLPNLHASHRLVREPSMIIFFVILNCSLLSVEQLTVI